MTLSPVERSVNDRISQEISGTLEPSQLAKMTPAPWQASLGGLLKSLQEAFISGSGSSSSTIAGSGSVATSDSTRTRGSGFMSIFAA